MNLRLVVKQAPGLQGRMRLGAVAQLPAQKTQELELGCKEKNGEGNRENGQQMPWEVDESAGLALLIALGYPLEQRNYME